MASILVLAHGGSWDRRYQVSALAASATTLGDSVELALFFGALDAWARGAWDRLDPAGPVTAEAIEATDFPPLSTLIEAARATGALTILACSASCRFLGLSPLQVQPTVDAIVGWQSFSQRITRCDRVVTF